MRGFCFSEELNFNLFGLDNVKVGVLIILKTSNGGIWQVTKVVVNESMIQIEDDARHLIQFYEKARVTSPLQTLRRLNHLNTRGFYFPAALENLLEYMNEQQTRDRHTAASYLLHRREMEADSDA